MFSSYFFVLSESGADPKIIYIPDEAFLFLWYLRIPDLVEYQDVLPPILSKDSSHPLRSIYASDGKKHILIGSSDDGGDILQHVLS
jgi:hypothetical protein